MSTEAIARDPETRVHPLTVAQYTRLVEAGDFTDQAVELLEGVVVDMSPQGPPHWSTTTRLGSLLLRRLLQEHGDRYDVGQNGPLVAGPRSQPEADVVVVDTEAFTWGVPVTTSPLVVEVAESSHRRDLLHKPRIYARAGVDRYWVVDLRDRVVHDHCAPGPDGYAEVTRRGFAEPMEVLGITVRLDEVVPA